MSKDIETGQVWYKLIVLPQGYEPKSTLSDLKIFENSLIHTDLVTWLENQIGVAQSEVNNPSLNIVGTNLQRGQLMAYIKVLEQFIPHTRRQLEYKIKKLKEATENEQA